MKLLKITGKAIKHRIIRYLNKERFINLSLEFPIISFTFDDFPSSAYRIAGNILEKYNIRATYYTSFGLMDSVYSSGKLFSIDDLKGLIADGHEIGCHTFNHINSDECSCLEYERNIIKNKEKSVELLGGYKLNNFSYPYGKGSFKLKRRIFKYFRSLRGILPGINVGWVDFGELRCNRLYTSTIDLSSVKELIQENKLKNGWLIFYTHDVCGNPSPFGCTPELLEKVVKLAVQSKARLWTMGQAVDYILANDKKRI